MPSVLAAGKGESSVAPHIFLGIAVILLLKNSIRTYLNTEVNILQDNFS
jgi:hypothetical protein